MSSLQPSLLPNATRDLARFAVETRGSEIPAEVIERVKLSFLDGLGVCLHGSTLPWTRKVFELVREEGGKNVASLWGSGHRTSLTNAVLVNSTAGHGFEMDDIHKESIVHPNSLAVPAALALAETLQGDLAQPYTLGDIEMSVGVSIGIAAPTLGDAENGADLVRNARLALDRAKQRGGGRAELFDDALLRDTKLRRRLSRELANASRLGQIFFEYQLVVTLGEDDRNVINGFETLMR